MSAVNLILLAVGGTYFAASVALAWQFALLRRDVDKWFAAYYRAATDLHAARAELAKRPLPQLRAPDGRYVSRAPK